MNLNKLTKNCLQNFVNEQIIEYATIQYEDFCLTVRANLTMTEELSIAKKVIDNIQDVDYDTGTSSTYKQMILDATLLFFTSDIKNVMDLSDSLDAEQLYRLTNALQFTTKLSQINPLLAGSIQRITETVNQRLNTNEKLLIARQKNEKIDLLINSLMDFFKTLTNKMQK